MRSASEIVWTDGARTAPTSAGDTLIDMAAKPKTKAIASRGRTAVDDAIDALVLTKRTRRLSDESFLTIWDVLRHAMSKGRPSPSWLLGEAKHAFLDVADDDDGAFLVALISAGAAAAYAQGDLALLKKMAAPARVARDEEERLLRAAASRATGDTPIERIASKIATAGARVSGAALDNRIAETNSKQRFRDSCVEIAPALSKVEVAEDPIFDRASEALVSAIYQCRFALLDAPRNQHFAEPRVTKLKSDITRSLRDLWTQRRAPTGRAIAVNTLVAFGLTNDMAKGRLKRVRF